MSQSKYSRDKYFDWLMLDSGQEVAVLRIAPSKRSSQKALQKTTNELREISRERFSMLFPRLSSKGNSLKRKSIFEY